MLVLRPTLAEMTTEEIEQQIANVRARRIVCALEYVAGEQMKLEAEKDKAHRKLKSHYEMLAKELDRSERAVYACEKRVAEIEQLRQEIGVLEDYEV